MRFDPREEQIYNSHEGERKLMFKKTNEKLFFKSTKFNDERIGERVKSFTLEELENISKEKLKFIIAGYADDEGIRNNSGRLGAHLAPMKIREHFYKMTPPSFIDFEIADIGDLDPSLCELSSRHEKVVEISTKAYRRDCRWIALGGGHDYAYADVSAFINSCDERPLIFNFDAHLDVRSTDKGINSGTPFYRILEEYKDIDLVQIGIQSQCNSIDHFKYCQDHKVYVLNYDDLRISGESLSNFCIKRLSHLLTKRRKCFLSVDIDGFSNAFAPGCSQSFATGLQPDEFFQLTSILNRRLDIRGLGIYECSPPLDRDDHTAKLAALIMHKFIFSI